MKFEFLLKIQKIKQMLSKAALCLPIFLVSVQVFSAQELLPQVRLRKLSLHIRGLTPEIKDYAELKAAVELGQADEYFAKKTKDYLDSEQHTARMLSRLEELFRLQTPEVPYELTKRPIAETEYTIKDAAIRANNALDELFRTIVQKNQNWDQLLVAKEFLAFEQNSEYSNSEQFPDTEFWRKLVPSLPKKSRKGLATDSALTLEDIQVNLDGSFNRRNYENTTLVSFDKDDSRIAGALTTNRFLKRYTNTNLNQNRKRAAAVFRIFLCDDMKPVVLPTNEEEQSLLDKVVRGILGDETDQAESANTSENKSAANDEESVKKHPKVLSEKDKHGSDSSCMSCHFKLDPMGKAFIPAAIVLGDQPSSGALVFKRDDGTMVNLPGNGIGDIAKSITQQPEYLRCQVRHFWRWFIGGDVTLTHDKLKELTNKFEQLERKPNDFIQYLVNSTDFYKKPGTQEAGEKSSVFGAANKALQSCSGCHAQSRSVPDFTQIPINGNEAENKKWIQKIISALDLSNGGKNATMPPENSRWSMKDKHQTQKAIHDWICAGAPNEFGKQTLLESDVPALCKGSSK